MSVLKFKWVAIKNEWVLRNSKYVHAMKKFLSVTALLAAVAISIHAAPVSAAAKKYSNCKSMNKAYPKGIAKSKGAAGKTGAKVSSTLYHANKKLDFDKDGIACEKTPSATSVPGSFGSGTKIIGSSIPPGRYISTTASGCYWERLSGFTGSFDEILANENPSGSHVIVDILPTDKGFNSSRCGTWTPFIPTPPTTFGEGTFAVGSEMPPGTWTAAFTSACYWSRISSFDGTFDSIIANGNPTGSAVVTILPTDVGFLSARCGTWTKIS